MLGALRKTVIGATALGLMAAGLTVNPPAATAAPAGCAITYPTEANVSLDVGHGGQPQKGTWTDVYNDKIVRPRFGLYYPVTDPDRTTHAVPRAENFGKTEFMPDTPVQTGDKFQFRLKGNCKENGVSFSSWGSGIGYCGRSVGMGTGVIGTGAAARTYIIRWESVGSQLAMLDPSALGSVNAQPNPPESANGSCVDGTAITFLIDGAIVDTDL